MNAVRTTLVWLLLFVASLFTISFHVNLFNQ